MSISAGGLMSGLDTDSIIQQLIQVERYPINQLQAKEAAYQLQLSTYGNLKGALGSLNSAMEGLEEADDFDKYKATSADTDYFTVTAGSDAAIGSYDITIHNLATEHKLTSAGFGESESVGAGTLTIQLGSSDAFTVEIESGDTIQDVADAINGKDGDVTAGVIFDGTDYYLALTGMDTGTNNFIKVTVDDTGDGNDTDTNGLSRLAFEDGVTENLTSEDPVDATIDVDGITGIKRTSNTLDDLISGITITLVKAHETPASESTKVTVSRDTGAIVNAVDAFINSYNDLVDFFAANQTFDEASGSAGMLLGDSTANLIQRRFRSLMSSDLSGMDAVSRLADIGITKDVDGKLSVDTSDLTEKLENNFNSVVQFFTQTTSGQEGFSVRMLDELDTMLDSYEGTLVARTDGIQNSIDNINDDVEQMERRLVAVEARMRVQFNNLELLLAEYQTTGNYLTQQITGLQNLSKSIANR